MDEMTRDLVDRARALASADGKEDLVAVLGGNWSTSDDMAMVYAGALGAASHLLEELSRRLTAAMGA